MRVHISRVGKELDNVGTRGGFHHVVVGLKLRQLFSLCHLRPDVLHGDCVLAGQDDVESRLVSLRGRRWSLQHGPFERDQLPARTRRAGLACRAVPRARASAGGMAVGGGGWAGASTSSA